MNVKIAILSALLVAIPVGVRAQDVDDYQNYRVSCNSGTECSNFNVDYQEDDKVAQTRRTRTRRTRRSRDSKYYVGGNIAPFFPFGDSLNGDDLDIGFGGGIFGGYKFTKNISAEIEVFDYFGGSETDDLGYNYFGATANGVYRYYIDPGSSDSLYVFAGLGIGIGVANETGDVADDRDDAGFDTSETGFLLQGKGGVGYPVSDKVDLFAQTKFFSIFIDGEDADGLAIDLGATYKF